MILCFSLCDRGFLVSVCRLMVDVVSVASFAHGLNLRFFVVDVNFRWIVCVRLVGFVVIVEVGTEHASSPK